MKTTDINQMSMLQLLDAFETRMEQLLKEDSKKGEPDQEPIWMTGGIKYGILPLVLYLREDYKTFHEDRGSSDYLYPWER